MAWSCMLCTFFCIGISHQVIVLDKRVHDGVSKLALTRYSQAVLLSSDVS